MTRASETRDPRSRRASRTATTVVLLTVMILLILTLLISPGGCRSSFDEGFAIYLLASEIPPAQLAALSHLEISDTPLVSGKDLLSYDRDTHAMEVTAEAYSRVMHLGIPLAGRSVAVCIDHHPVYAGALVTSISSISVDAVVICQPLHTHDSLDRYVLKLELGYPGPAHYTGEDPRSASEVIEVLERDGKLR